MNGSACVAFINVTVHPLTSPEPLRDQTVVVRGDRIERIGAASAVDVPADATRVDGRGRFLIPGLAEMHGHPRSEADLVLYVANGVTTVRNMHGAPRHVIWRERIARGEMLGPTLHTTGPITDGDPTMRFGAASVRDSTEARVAVERASRIGYQAVKAYDHLERDAYDGITAAAREFNLPVYGHVAFRVGLDVVLAARQRSIEHLYGYVEALQPQGSPLRECRVDPVDARRMLASGAFKTIERERIGDLVAATLAAGTWNCPTLLIRKRHLQTLEDLLALPANRYVGPMQLDGWREFKRTYPYDTSLKPLELDVHRELTVALHRAGAGILAGTDASVHFIHAGSSLHEELAELAAAGLTPYEVLVVASRRAAEFLDESKEWGTVEVGKRADLVLLAADPTARIGNTRSIEGVVVRGRWITRDEIDALLAEIAAKSARPFVERADEPPQPDGAFDARYQLTASGRAIGTEDLSIGAAPNGVGLRIRSQLRCATFTGLGFDGWDPAAYRTEISLDEAGEVRGVSSVSETLDGVERIELRRDGDAVEVTRKDPLLGTTRTRHDVPAEALLGRAHMATYFVVASRVRSLRPGGTTTLALFGPGMPPDDQLFETIFEIERADGDTEAREYRFTARRRNGVYRGILRCDARGRPESLDFVRRHPQLSNEAQLGDSEEFSVRIRRVAQSGAAAGV